MLKLEKENQELQTSVETLKEEKHLLQEQQLHTQELGRENQGFSNKVCVQVPIAHFSVAISYTNFLLVGP